MRNHLAAFALAASLLASALPVQAGARVYVQIGPPVAVVETRVVAPSARHIWIAGYHRWDGRAYVWVPGRWELPPARYAAWVSGRWAHHHAHGWYWVEGHWR